MKRGKLILLVVSVVLLLGALAWIYIPTSVHRQMSAICRVEARSGYVVNLGQGDTLFLSLTPEKSPAVSVKSEKVMTSVDISGFFISRQGHVLTTDSLLLRCPDTLRHDELLARLQNSDSLLRKHLVARSAERKELDYYARKHSVVDDGYNEVMSYREAILQEIRLTDSTLKKVEKALKRADVSAVLHTEYQVRPAASSVSLRADRLRRADSLLMLQLQSRELPAGAARYSVHRLGAYPWRSELLAFNDFGGLTAMRVPMKLSPDSMFFPATEGGAWVNPSGILCGIQCGGRRHSSWKLSAFVAQEHSWPGWWKANAEARYREWRGEKESAQEADYTLKPEELVCFQFMPSDSTCYVGQVKKSPSGKAIRQGYGKLSFDDGRVYAGRWDADTLVSGLRTDSTGVYNGRFNARMQAQGIGSLHAADGEYYEGSWKENHRFGLGFSSKSGRIVHCGNWKNDRFRGERMVYTADRIYGIDISRYQHDIKRRVYGIDWAKLRITSLGVGRRVQGHVDYPVSFVYIKSTEGKTVFNRYYPNDVRQARKHGLVVGSYHFFSPYTKGREQALHFMRKASVQAGDLPPVLDLEPTDAQVRIMGGDSLMFREVLTWLHLVENKYGKRPVLYVGQNFVNKHLSKAPKELMDYDVWVARYGEFKPYVHLLHWQLTPYGRVRGIHGQVDINVYNGTKEQFLEYLSEVRKSN